MTLTGTADEVVELFADIVEEQYGGYFRWMQEHFGSIDDWSIDSITSAFWDTLSNECEYPVVCINEDYLDMEIEKYIQKEIK